MGVSSLFSYDIEPNAKFVGSIGPFALIKETHCRRGCKIGEHASYQSRLSMNALCKPVGTFDCILKCEKPVDLPVQAPTKYELVTAMSPMGVRRDKAALSSGCKPHPAR